MIAGISRVNTPSEYLVLLLAALMGFSRGGLNFVMAVLILIALRQFFLGRSSFAVNKDLRTVMLFFFAVLFLSSVFSRDVITSFKFLTLSLVHMLPVFVVVMVVQKRKITEQAVFLMGLSLLIGSALALWQASRGVVRVTGGLGMMDFAGIVGLMAPMLIVKSFDKSFERWQRSFLLLSAVTGMFALLFNQTRAVWLAIVINCIIFVVLKVVYDVRQSRQAAVTAVVILALMILFMTTNQFMIDRVNSITDMNFSSNRERILMWNYAADVFSDNWLLGVGLATTPSFSFSYTPGGAAELQTVQPYGHVHNNLLQMMAENGVLGGIAYIALFLTILRTAVKNMKRPETRDWAMIAFLCTAEFLMHGMFDYTFSIGTIMFSYWFILGLAYVNFREWDERT